MYTVHVCKPSICNFIQSLQLYNYNNEDEGSQCNYNNNDDSENNDGNNDYDDSYDNNDYNNEKSLLLLSVSSLSQL